MCTYTLRVYVMVHCSAVRRRRSHHIRYRRDRPGAVAREILGRGRFTSYTGMTVLQRDGRPGRGGWRRWGDYGGEHAAIDRRPFYRRYTAAPPDFRARPARRVFIGRRGQRRHVRCAASAEQAPSRPRRRTVAKGYAAALFTLEI